MSKTGEALGFEYNEDGLRVKKTATSTGTTEYTLHGKNIVHMTQGNHALHFYYDAQGKPSIVIYNGTAYGYLYNLQGDVIALVDGTGTNVVEYTYDAWGKPIAKTGSLASTLGTVQPFRYRGYVYDEETGLYYLRSRYYRPEWSRFVSADVQIYNNVYSYCNNNPITNIDPDGFEPLGYGYIIDPTKVDPLFRNKNDIHIYTGSYAAFYTVLDGPYQGQYFVYLYAHDFITGDLVCVEAHTFKKNISSNLGMIIFPQVYEYDEYYASQNSNEERKKQFGMYMDIVIEAHQINVPKAINEKDYFSKRAKAIQGQSGYLTVDGDVGVKTVEYIVELLKQLTVFGGNMDYDPLLLIQHHR